jgi:hypothetical protein
VRRPPPRERLPWFRAASSGAAPAGNTRRLALRCADPATRPHDQGVLVLDETGARQDGPPTDHVAPHSRGSIARRATGIGSVTSLWAAEQGYPVHVVPYPPARRLPPGKADPACRTQPQRAPPASASGRWWRLAATANIRRGSRHWGEGGLPDALARRAHRGSWALADEPHPPEDGARRVLWGGPARPGSGRSGTGIGSAGGRPT